MKLIAELIVQAFILILTGLIIPGFHIENFFSALILAVALAILNAILKPILTFLTLPATIITLGLFSFVINAVLILIASKIVPGFAIDSFWTAVLSAVVIAIVSAIVKMIIK